MYCRPAYFIFMHSTLWETPGWMKHKLESRLSGEISITSLRYAGDSTRMAESKEELKSLLMKVKEESEKAGLKLNTEKRRPWHFVPSLHGKLMGKQWKQWQTLFSWAPESLQMMTAAMIKDACSLVFHFISGYSHHYLKLTSNCWSSLRTVIYHFIKVSGSHPVLRNFPDLLFCRYHSKSLESPWMERMGKWKTLVILFLQISYSARGLFYLLLLKHSWFTMW